MFNKKSNSLISYLCLCLLLTAGTAAKPRAYSMTAYKSAPGVNPDHAHHPHHLRMSDHTHHHHNHTHHHTHHHHRHPRMAISPGLRPISTSTLPPPRNPKTFSFSADNLDSEPCEPTPPNSRPTSHTGSHDRASGSSSRQHRGSGEGRGVGLVTTPTGYPRGHLSVSMGNMQTHV